MLTSDKAIASKLKNEKVGIVVINSTHLNSALSHDVVVGLAPPLAIAAGISALANNRNDYVATLNRDSVAAIDAVLCNTTAFQYVPALNPVIHFNNPHVIDSQSTISQAMAAKGLSWGLGLEMDYGIITGFHKQMATRITWLLYDSSGNKRSVITTIVSSGRKEAVFPNTTDATYHDVYVTIAQKCAADFLSFLIGEVPRFQQELSVFKMTEFRSGSSRIFSPKNSGPVRGGW